jgi:phage minor structural protein
MIRLFIKGETAFDHNKYVLSDCISATVAETTDGILDLDLEYPLKDRKNLSGLLVRGNIIKCPISATDARGEQLFTIRTRNPVTSDNKVKIYAQAIARRDLDVNMVVDLEIPAGTTRKNAIQMVLNKCAESHNYHVGDLDTSTNTSVNLGLDEKTGNTIDYIDINGISPRKALLAEDVNSIFKAYGGEIIYNNFEINMVDERGTDNSFEIRSGKNLEELEQTIDDTDTESFATAVMPCSSDGLYLPNHEIIYSPNASTFGKIYKQVIFDDVKIVVNTPAGLDSVYGQLRERVQKLFDNGLDKLRVNNTVKFTQLANTEEYKNYSILEKCEIGNNVTIKYYEPFDPDKKTYIEAVGRVLKIKFNVLTNRIDEVEIGDRKKKNIITAINNNTDKTQNLDDKNNTTNKKIDDIKSTTDKNINDLTVIMQKSDSDILLEVKNNKTDTDAAIQVMDGHIQERVTTTEFQSYKDQTADTISQKVSKGSQFGSELTQHFDEIVETINDGTEHQCIFDASGLSVKNGGFRIINSSGETVMWINSSGYVKVEDIEFGESAFSDSSWLVSSFANIDKLTLANLSIGGKLIIDQSDFYLTIDGQSGYNLNQAIDKRLNDHRLI